jgi:putative transcriptional regulator
MSKKAYEGIAQGLREAIAFAKGDAVLASKTKVHRVKGGRLISRPVHSPRPADVKAARKQVGLSRDEFALTFGLSPATLRKWENGERHPAGAARTLLTIIAREPKAVLRAIRE